MSVGGDALGVIINCVIGVMVVSCGRHRFDRSCPKQQWLNRQFPEEIIYWNSSLWTNKPRVLCLALIKHPIVVGKMPLECISRRWSGTVRVRVLFHRPGVRFYITSRAVSFVPIGIWIFTKIAKWSNISADNQSETLTIPMMISLLSQKFANQHLECARTIPDLASRLILHESIRQSPDDRCHRQMASSLVWVKIFPN